jgi:hypothetical protein
MRSSARRTLAATGDVQWFVRHSTCRCSDIAPSSTASRLQVFQRGRTSIGIQKTPLIFAISFSSQGKVTLHELCRLMGLPVKPDGSAGRMWRGTFMRLYPRDRRVLRERRPEHLPGVMARSSSVRYPLPNVMQARPGSLIYRTPPPLRLSVALDRLDIVLMVTFNERLHS